MPEIRNASPERTHLYPWDCAACEEFATRMGVSEAKLRKAIRMVGTRVTTLSSYLKTLRPAPNGRVTAGAPFSSTMIHELGVPASVGTYGRPRNVEASRST